MTVKSNLPNDAYSYTEIEHVIISSGVTSIGMSAFLYCQGLTSVTIPNSVTSIGYGAFYACSALTSIEIPNSVTSIGDVAFYYCEGLASVTIGNSVTSIGTSTFERCTGLTSIEIPNSVEYIEDYAFAGCGLTSITIPNSVTSIGEGAFYYCTGLTSVTNYATTPQTIESNVFGEVDLSSCTLYVPAESASAYSTASVWQDFGTQSDIPEPAPQGEEIIPNVDPQNASVYYSTFYDSAKKYELPAGVEAYVATIGENVLNLTRIAVAGQVIPNDNAVILKSTVTPFTLTPSEADAVTFSATNSLQGTDEAIANPGNCYVLSDEGGKMGFYEYNGNQLNAHKAYITLPGSGNAPRRMRFIFAEEQTATGAESATTNVESRKVIENGQLIIIRNGVRYNAAGQVIE